MFRFIIFLLLLGGGIYFLMQLFTREPRVGANGSALQPQTFQELTFSDEYTVIDLRTEQELTATGVIEGLDLHKDVYNSDDVAELDQLPKDGKYLLYCAHGNRSRVVKERLLDNGYEYVYDLSGGIEFWAEKKFKLIPRTGSIQ